MEEIDLINLFRIEPQRVQICAFCGSEMPVTDRTPAICNSCRDAILWAKKKMEAERIEKLNEKTRKEDEERWRKIMQGTV